MVIGVDKDKEKVSLGLKQKTASPWENIEDKYPVGSRVKGTVVNVMNYGVFVRLEEGVEGLVHISEMSWTKRLSHPSEMLVAGDEVEAVVLNVNKEKQEISLGLKQTEMNPWEIAAQKYPPGTVVDATVRSMTNFGAFVEIEEGVDGMIHISDISWTKKFNHPNEALEKGQKVQCVVLDVDQEKQRMSLGLKQLTEDPWQRAIPEKYLPGQIVKGKVTKLTAFGAFVQLEDELEGLLHISELADHKIDKPQDVVKEGEEVEVKILKVDTDSRKIGLSLRRVQWAAEETEEGKPKSDKKSKKEPQKRGPVAVQTVLSDDHVEELAGRKQQDQSESESTAGADSEPSEQKAEAEEEKLSDQSHQEQSDEPVGEAESESSQEQGGEESVQEDQDKQE